MSSICPLTRAITRRVGDLVIRIDPEGLSVRGHRKRTWRRYSWEQVLSLSHEEDLLAISEKHHGSIIHDVITGTVRRNRNVRAD